MNSNPESVDKVSSNLENGDDDVFIDEKSSTNILDQVTEESKIVDSNHSDSCDTDNLNKESNTTDISKPLIEVEILPHRDEFETVVESPTGRKSPDDCLSETIDPSSSKLMNSEDVSETIDPPPSKFMNSEDESPSTPLDYKSSVFSNSSNSSCEVNNTESSREFHYDQTKKTRRKMPKNFFVRKKIRRNRNTAVGSDTSSQDLVVTSAPSETETVVENTTIPSSLAQNEINRRNNYLSGDNQSDLSVTCDTSRLNCVYDLEHSSPIRLNENPGSSLPDKSEDKSTLRNCGRGLKRPGKGHFREDTKRRRTRNLSTTCRDCDVTFKNKEELTRHNAYRHARRRELHHCLLCQRSFSSAARHSLHVQGRSHRHLELTQRHTMHTIHRLVAGHDCPAIPPLTRAELRALQWRPNQPGYTHVYHDTTPLHTVLRERSSDLSEDTVLSGDKIGDD
ncbi:dentin sialophosphoprotein-like [Macrosteles quadrilineatus]|uniref:dentin sialophosphoprotein-like n=1 Tax=Macrosteles quadrilineatus TaxID=74068 RepID=UPI0023E2B885|nr:dentin sialophosphoprotein-like [Macrosteles quadrilineatus]